MSIIPQLKKLIVQLLGINDNTAKKEDKDIKRNMFISLRTKGMY